MFLPSYSLCAPPPQTRFQTHHIDAFPKIKPPWYLYKVSKPNLVFFTCGASPFISHCLPLSENDSWKSLERANKLQLGEGGGRDIVMSWIQRMNVESKLNEASKRTIWAHLTTKLAIQAWAEVFEVIDRVPLNIFTQTHDVS